MLKKSLLIIGISGALLIIAGLILHPALLNSAGVSLSDWTLVKIQLIRYYFIITGAVIVLEFLILRKLPEEKRTRHLLLALAILGAALTIAGVIFSPSFARENFSPAKFIMEDGLLRLLTYQIIVVTTGCLLIFIPLLIYTINNLKKFKWFAVPLLLIGLLVYLILFQITYVKTKYPSNIIFKAGEYHKVVQLLLGQNILLSDFQPRSTLKVDRVQIHRAKFPVVDVHFHFGSSFMTENDRKVLSPENLLKSMDSVGVRIIANCDGGNYDLESFLDRYGRKYPERFVNWYPSGFPRGIMKDITISALPKKLEEAVKTGAIGDGELYKHLGLDTRDESGKVIPVDDPRLDPLWEKAGELGVPVLWHMGDPAATFQPVNKFNERYIQMKDYPQWSHYGPGIPSRESILKGRENVLKKHPNTIIIGAHMGQNVDDLKYIAYLLDTYPNYYVEPSSTLSDLGKQPYTTRKFFIKYQDRILFGTDGGSLFGVKGWTVEKFYRAYFEFFETENELISYPMQGAINQGNWKIYGIALPDSVLEKIYYKNAEKILLKRKISTGR